MGNPGPLLTLLPPSPKPNAVLPCRAPPPVGLRRHFVRCCPAPQGRAGSAGRDELSLAFKSATRVGPSSSSYEQALHSSTTAWPAAPRAGHPAGSKAVRGNGGTRAQEPAGHVCAVHTILFTGPLAAARHTGPARHRGKRGRLHKRSTAAPSRLSSSLGAQ